MHSPHPLQLTADRGVQRLTGLASVPRLLLLAIWLSAFAAFRMLASPDEGRYSDIARWMAMSGDWLVPRLDGLPFLHKPPLYFWLQASVFKLLGANLLTARVVSMTAAVVMAASVYALVKRFADERRALWSALMLATTPLFAGGAQYANLDMLVAGIITATIALAILSVNAETASRQRWLCYAAYIAAACGMLAKGLVGVALPGAIFVLAAVSMRRLDWLAKMISPVGIALFAIIAAPWFLILEQKIPGFNRYFFYYHHFERYLSGQFNNPRGVWFFPLIALVGALPWTALAYERFKSWRGEPAAAEPDLLIRLGIVWTLTILIFFSAPRSKLIGYIFPLLPGLALLIGPWLADFRRRGPFLAIAASLCMALGAAAPFAMQSTPRDLAYALRDDIKATHRVVFWRGYFYDVPFILQRQTPTIAAGNGWSEPSRLQRDNWHRELTEGGEFDPVAAKKALLTEQQALDLVSSAGTSWIFAEANEATSHPVLSKLPVVARNKTYVVLKAAGQGS